MGDKLEDIVPISPGTIVQLIPGSSKNFYSILKAISGIIPDGIVKFTPSKIVLTANTGSKNATLLFSIVTKGEHAMQCHYYYDASKHKSIGFGMNFKVVSSQLTVAADDIMILRIMSDEYSKETLTDFSNPTCAIKVCSTKTGLYEDKVFHNQDLDEDDVNFSQLECIKYRLVVETDKFDSIISRIKKSSSDSIRITFVSSYRTLILTPMSGPSDVCRESSIYLPVDVFVKGIYNKSGKFVTIDELDEIDVKNINEIRMDSEESSDDDDDEDEEEDVKPSSSKTKHISFKSIMKKIGKMPSLKDIPPDEIDYDEVIDVSLLQAITGFKSICSSHLEINVPYKTDDDSDEDDDDEDGMVKQGHRNAIMFRWQNTGINAIISAYPKADVGADI